MIFGSGKKLDEDSIRAAQEKMRAELPRLYNHLRLIHPSEVEDQIESILRYRDRADRARWNVER